MSRYRRSKTPGGTYFFTINSYRRRPVLIEPEVRAGLRLAIAQVRQTPPFIVHAWVLMPDHLHCIWELPAGDAAYGWRWGQLKRSVTQQCRHLLIAAGERSASRQRRHEGLLWQRRFCEHQIRDDADFERHMDYIHWNPVKHGHVARVVDWPYSTFHRYLAVGIYPQDWGGGDAAESTGEPFGE